MSTDQSQLEAIPHLCKKICLIWGSPELEAFVITLLMDSRDGNRKGLPVEVGSELLWLAQMNKLRRAMELSDKLNINLDDALTKLSREVETGRFDPWGDPNCSGATLGRRYSDRPRPVRPHRRHEENTVFGIVYGFLTSRYALLAIIAILAAKSMWPYLRRPLHVLCHASRTGTT